VGTPFAKTRTPLQLWFYAIHLFTTTRHGVSGKELQRQLGVTYKTAWRMADEIRKHMAMVDGDDQIGGPGTAVEVDETLVGGVKKGKHNRGSAAKSVVVGALERGGELITAVVPNQLHTDELQSYSGLHKKKYRHMTVNHGAGEYVGYQGATVNSIEGFWRHLKASINGTHVWVSAKHLGKYAKEFEYRFNRRGEAHQMLPELLSTFQPLPPKSR
jgi:transposase